MTDKTRPASDDMFPFVRLNRPLSPTGRYPASRLTGEDYRYIPTSREERGLTQCPRARKGTVRMTVLS